MPVPLLWGQVRTAVVQQLLACMPREHLSTLGDCQGCLLGSVTAPVTAYASEESELECRGFSTHDRSLRYRAHLRGDGGVRAGLGGGIWAIGRGNAVMVVGL